MFGWSGKLEKLSFVYLPSQESPAFPPMSFSPVSVLYFHTEHFTSVTKCVGFPHIKQSSVTPAWVSYSPVLTPPTGRWCRIPRVKGSVTNPGCHLCPRGVGCVTLLVCGCVCRPGPPEPYAVGAARRPDPRAPPSLVPSLLWRMGVGRRCKLQGSHPGSVFPATSLHPGAAQSHLIRTKGAPGAPVTWEFMRSPTSGARGRYQHTCFLRPHTWRCWVNRVEGNMFLSPGESGAGKSPARPPLGGLQEGRSLLRRARAGKHPEACQPGEAEEV